MNQHLRAGMFGWGRKKVVEVRFIDADTGQQFAQASVPPDQLPKSFEASTTMHLGESDWQVVQATPVTADEFARTGRLQLTLRRVNVGQVNPAELLYSLPTISNELADIEKGTTKLGRAVLEMHEDDWRQIEFVSAACDGAVNGALEGIRRIYAEQRQAPGIFKKLHVREGLGEPIPPNEVPLSELAALIPEGARRLDGVSYSGVAGTIAHAFAWQVSGRLALYGRADQGKVRELGLFFLAPPGEIEAFGRALARFARGHRLALLDWCRARRIEPDEEALLEWLRAGDRRLPGQPWPELA